MVALANLVTIGETVAPKELNHFNKLRAATLTATLAPGYSMGEALTFLDGEAAKLPPGVVTDLNGQSREFRSSTGGSISRWAWQRRSSSWSWQPSSKAGSTRSSSC